MLTVSQATCYRLNAEATQKAETDIFISQCLDRSIRLHQFKSVELDFTFSGFTTVKHTDGCSSQISGILVNPIILCVDALKFRIRHDRFAAHYNMAFVCNLFRKPFKKSRVMRDFLAFLSVTSCDSTGQFSVVIGDYHSQTVHFPGKYTRFIRQPAKQGFALYVLDFIQ